MKNSKELQDHDVVSSKLEKAWVARVSPDDRSSMVYGYYGSHYLASESVAGKSWYGSNGTVDREPINVLTLEFADGETRSFNLGQVFKVQHESEADRKAREEHVRQIALAKLTTEEREALGL